MVGPSIDRSPAHILREHAIEAVVDLPHEGVDCFDRERPTVVPARTLFSQFSP
jgi:hypothetical protein